jgi:hypothetical protein
MRRPASDGPERKCGIAANLSFRLHNAKRQKRAVIPNRMFTDFLVNIYLDL